MFEEWFRPADMRDGPPDKHVSVLFEAELIGAHVHVRVRAATRHPSVQVDHSRGLCGELVFVPAEWLLLHHALRAIGAHPPEAYLVERRDGGHGRVTKIAGAGPEASEHDDQQFIELKGWPE